MKKYKFNIIYGENSLEKVIIKILAKEILNLISNNIAYEHK